MPTAVNLPQLLDQCLGTPEVGAVNFNQLHKLLFEIIARLDTAGHPFNASETRPSQTTSQRLGDKNPDYSTVQHLTDKINKIEKNVEDLSALPSAGELIDKVKSDQPLKELWQYMQLSKKVENNEDGIKTVRIVSCYFMH